MTSASIREVISQFRPHELYSMNRNLVQELTLETLLNKAGDISFQFNTTGMYRGSIDVDGYVTVAIYQDK